MTRRRHPSSPLRPWHASSLCAMTLAGLMLAALPRPVAADPTATELALAEALFREGKRLMAAKQYEQACAKLAASLRLDRAGGTLLNLAVCHERMGKLTTAWVELTEALGLARAARRQDRVQFAEARLAAIRQRLAFVVISVAGTPPPGLQLWLDKVLLGAAIVNTPVPIDPGAHRIRAAAPGRTAWEETVTVHAGERRHVRVPGLAALVADQPASGPSPATPMSDRRLAAYITGGAGLGLAVVGTVLGIRAIAKENESDSHCQEGLCDQEGLNLSDQAQTAALGADITLAVGIAAVGVATYLWLTGRPDRTREQPLTVSPTVGAGGGGVVVGGTF